MHGRDRDEAAVADERAQHACDLGGFVVVLVVVRRPFRLGAGREREGLAQKVQRPVVTLDDEADVDEAPQRAGRGTDLEARLPPDRGDVGCSEDERGEDGAPVVVGEEPDQLPGGERRRRHAY